MLENKIDTIAFCDGEGIPYRIQNGKVALLLPEEVRSRLPVVIKNKYDIITDELIDFIQIIMLIQAYTEREAFEHLIRYYSRPISTSSLEFWEPLIPIPISSPNRIISSDIHKMGRAPDKEYSYYTIDGRRYGINGKWYRSNNEIISLPFIYCKHKTTEREKWKCMQFPAPAPLFGVQYLKDWSGPVAVVESEELCVAVNRGVGDCCLPLTWYGGIADIEKADWSPLAGSEVVYKVITDSEEKGNEILRRIQEALKKC